ncbi:MAG: DUF1614 domain-containing protein [Dehalococcoidales bacterium]|nr:DUF1614 domain-containing protein [Dehalococcoidales bacterium]
MGCLTLLLPILIILPILIFLILLNVITISYNELGLSQTSAIVLLIATLVGSMINIPISRRQVVYEEPQTFLSRFFFYLPPKVATQTVAINVGGALIPALFALYLLPRAPILETLAATAVIILVSRLLSYPVAGMGIVMPAFIPPLASAGLALLLARTHPAPVAYISGTLGTLIGADLLNWNKVKRLGPHMISIGGAGVFDGVFLAGTIAVLITAL